MSDIDAWYQPLAYSYTLRTTTLISLVSFHYFEKRTPIIKNYLPSDRHPLGEHQCGYLWNIALCLSAIIK